jgi:hypothetical protein
MTRAPKIAGMIVFSGEGPRSIDDRDVLAVYRAGGDGRYTHCTLVLRGGSEISGAVLNAALDALEAKLDDFGPPPIAA